MKREVKKKKINQWVVWANRMLRVRYMIGFNVFYVMLECFLKAAVCVFKDTFCLFNQKSRLWEVGRGGGLLLDL